MDVAVFFLPIALVVGQYFASIRKPRLAHSPLECAEPRRRA